MRIPAFRLTGRAARACALLLPFLLVACADRVSLLEPESATSPSTAESQTLAVVTTASPAETAPGESVSITINITNNTGKKVMVEVLQVVTDPAGAQISSRTWQKQNIPSNKTVVLENTFTSAVDAAAGMYLVGVRITSSDQHTVYYDSGTAASFTVSPPLSRFYYSRETNPDRTLVHDAAGSWLATFTDGSHTVALTGATRTFAEPVNTSYTVTHGTWVRVLPSPFAGVVDEAWLAAALADTAPDMLQIAMQYIVDAPPIYDASGLQIAGDADYGPLQEDGTRKAGADWNDYLGVDWIWNGKTYAPRAEFFRSIDCTGFVQIVFGYRGGLPLSRLGDGTGIPRNARGTYSAGPGIIIISNEWVQVTDFSRLQIGDLVFFDANDDGIEELHHVGFFLGIDSGGNHRFIHSIKTPNGPTLGDNGTRSMLNTINEKGYWALGFRATRRL